MLPSPNVRPPPAFHPAARRVKLPITWFAGTKAVPKPNHGSKKSTAVVVGRVNSTVRVYRPPPPIRYPPNRPVGLNRTVGFAVSDQIVPVPPGTLSCRNTELLTFIWLTMYSPVIPTAGVKL